MNISSLFLRAFALLSLCLTYVSVSATHYMGVDITYECITNCIYRIYHNTYYDCSGSAVSGNVPISTSPPPAQPGGFTISAPGGCAQPVALGASWTFVSWTEVTPICPTTSTQCENGTSPIRGVGEARYYRDYDFCSVNCTQPYTLEWGTCCRNGAITGLNNPNLQGIYSGSTQINTNLGSCNSSPQFANPPVPYLCKGDPFTFNQGAFDPDGDSLAYSLGTCFDDPGVPVQYAAGYTSSQPLGPGWDVQINAQTGDITMTPNPNGPAEVGVLCIVVEEYRNGVLIGQVVRDIQITVIDCSLFGSTNLSPTITQVTNLSPGAMADSLTISACAGEVLSFDIPSNDPDTGQTYIMYWNGNLPGGTFSDATNPTVSVDSVFSTGSTPTGRITWTPPTAGTYTVLITIQDDGCPILGINQYTIVIEAQETFATADRVGCYGVQFEGFPCGLSPPFTLTWNGAGNLSATGTNPFHTYPGPGSYPYTLTVTDAGGATTTFSSTVELTPGADADAGPDLFLCPGEVGTIGTAAVPDYIYQWSSPGGIGWSGPPNPATAQADVALSNGTNNPIPFQYYLSAEFPTGCFDYDTVTVTYNPIPPSDFSATNTVCVGELSTVIYTAPQVPGSVYHWDFDGGSGTSTGPGPHLVSWSSAGQKTVKLWVDVNGCASDTSEVMVQVNPIPTANFIVTNQVCAGLPVQINYTGSANRATSTFIWDFDGGSGPGGAGPFGVTWTTPGLKTVTLTVIDKGCVSSSFTQTVDVFPVPTSDFSIASSVCEEGLVQIVYTGTATAAAAFSWNFDGAQVISGSGIGPYTVQWTLPGPRNVCLQVEENGCLSPLTCNTIDVLPDPVARIDFVSNQCEGGNSFNFTSTGDANVDTYAWDFGVDAVPPTSTAASPPAVTYQDTGRKVVTLVTTRNGCVSDTARITFEVVPEPSADFTTSTNAICSGDCITYTYTGQVVGPNQTYFWNFGAGAVPQTFSGPAPPCVSYPAGSGGIKDVTLEVSFKGCVTQTTQQITISEGPVVNAGANVEFCEGDGGVQIQANVSGGTAPLFYSWECDDPPNCGLSSNAVEDPIANPNVTINNFFDEVVYWVTVTDVNGCVSAVDSVRVRVKAKPRMDAGPDLYICTDGPGEFLQGDVAPNNKAPEPISYDWAPASGLSDPGVPNPFARPVATTIYTLVGTSVNGCSSDVTTLDTLSTATVHVLSKPVAEAGKDSALCLGETIRLQGFGSGAGPNYSYRWTPAPPGVFDDPTSPTPNITPQVTTTYFLVVSSNGCASDSSAVTVIVDTRPTVSAGNNADVCLNSEVMLDGRAAGDPGASNYMYSWTPGTGLSDSTIAQPLASPSVTTLYTVTATSNFGCGSDAVQVLVTVKPTPEVEALSPDTVMCEGDEITLRAAHVFNSPVGSPVIYTWSPAGAVVGDPQQATITVSPKTTTLFKVKTSVSSDDCPTFDSVLVTVSPEVIADVTADTTRFCRGDVTQLFASGGQGNADFTWLPPFGLDNPNIANPIAGPDSSVEYMVIVSEGACADTASLNLTINPTPVADYFASHANGCTGLTVSFIENSPEAIAFRWDFGDGSPISNESNPEHTYDQPGDYLVTLTAIGVGGCETTTSRTTVSVTDNSFADFLSQPVEDSRIPLPDAVVEFSDQSANTVGWLWDFGDGTTSSSKSPVHKYREPGTYSVTLTVTDENGCVSTIVKGPYEVFAPEVMIPNVFTPNADGVNDEFRVAYDGSETLSVEVFDRWGRSFFSAEGSDEPWRGMDKDGNPAQEGVYFYAVKIGEKTYNGNVTLMR